MKIGKLIILFMVLGIIYAGCDDTVNPDEIYPTSNVSYSQHVGKILNNKCTSSGCHNNEDRAGNLALTSRMEVMIRGDIVVVGLPENSRLLTHVHQENIIPLTDNERDCISAWIKEGAKPN
ncbi:MAG TPA: c-type cytochrome domain-containing protein [Ignavibacteriales bacterium]|nr:c-type cytochrome domain-containing protein [Ignavibacteriales bacterium]